MVHLNVVALDSAVRLTRANTLRSSSYEAKAERLAAFLQKRLTILEEKLFKEKFRLEECSAGQMQKPEGRFTNAEGDIWFFFSNQTRKFVLLDFAFGEGGSGGLPIPADSGSTPRHHKHRHATHRASNWAARRVAKLSATVGRFITSPFIFSFLPKRAALLLWDTRAFELRMGEDCYLPRTPVPEWSILSSLIATPEQLENRYARSILAGEALCRVTIRSGFAKALLPEKDHLCGYPHISSELLRESTLVLNLIFAGRLDVGTRLRRFKLTQTLKEHPLADDGILSIVRSELTAHLSLYVAGMATQVECRAKESQTDRHRIILRILKKYSLLSDFAVLSEQLLIRPKIDAATYWREHAPGLKGLVAGKALRDIEKFDMSVHILTTGLEADRPESAGNIGNLATLHSQLLNVTAELFDPLE